MVVFTGVLLDPRKWGWCGRWAPGGAFSGWSRRHLSVAKSHLQAGQDADIGCVTLADLFCNLWDVGHRHIVNISLFMAAMYQLKRSVMMLHSGVNTVRVKVKDLQARADGSHGNGACSHNHISPRVSGRAVASYLLAAKDGVCDVCRVCQPSVPFAKLALPR